MLRLLLTILIFAGPPAIVTAGDSSPADRYAAVAPFVDENTTFIIHVRVDRIDIDAILDWCIEVINRVDTDEEDREAMRRFIEERRNDHDPREGIDAFKRAGGRSLFVLLDPGMLLAMMEGRPGNRSAIVVVPLPPGADAASLTHLLIGREDGTREKGVPDPIYPGAICRERNGALVAATKPVMDHLLEHRGVERPDLARAFDAISGADHRIVFSPPEYVRRAFEEIMPTLPRELGEKPTSILTRGLEWAAAGVNLPPQPAVHAIIQTPDEDRARELSGLLDALRGRVVSRTGPNETESLDVKRLAEGLKPAMQQNQLVLRMDSNQILTLAADFVAPVVRSARAQAMQVQVATQIKQIVQACLIYTESHKGQWPDELQVLIENHLLDASLLKLPTRPQYDVGFVYIKPPLPVGKTDPRNILVYERHDEWSGGINVGYADGHVEFILKQEVFERALEQTRKSYKPKPEQKQD
jgi:prepilin-type processing-associated H-X9-DG protein